MSTFNQWAKKKPRNGPIRILPGIQSNPSWARHLVSDLVPSFLDFEMSSDAKRYGVEGFSRLLSFPGYTMDPWGLPEVSPESLLYRYTNSYALAMHHYMEILFPYEMFRSTLCEQNLSIRKIANSGYPEYTTDLATKTQMIYDTFRALPQIRQAVLNDDMQQLQRLGISYVMLVKRRFQPDTVQVVRNDRGHIVSTTPKARYVSISEGDDVMASKTIDGLKDVYALRVRNVEAMPLRANIIGMPINNAMNKCRFTVAPLTTHATDIRGTLRAIGGRLSGYTPLSGDITQLDAHCNSEVLRLFITAFARQVGLQPWISKHLFQLFFSSWIANGIWHDREEDLPYTSGNPLRPATQAIFSATINSLASGHILTTAAGCAVVVSALMDSLARIGVVSPTVHARRAMLTWEPDQPVYISDQSDDVLIWVRNDLVEKVRTELPKAMSEGYNGLQFAFDDHPSYLSNQIVQIDGEWRAIPDIARAFCKTLIPESSRYTWYTTAKSVYNTEQMLHRYGVHGVADKEVLRASTKYPSFGLMQRNMLYQREHPLFSYAWDKLMESVERFSPQTPTAIQQLALIEQEALERTHVDALNVFDLEVLEDPSKLQWKFTPEEISDGIYKTEFSSIDAEFIHSFKPYYLE